MQFGKRKLLTAFLEKDNLKLLSYEISGKSLTRTFGGQISFTADVVRESFIADPVKFSSQVKMALGQKPEFADFLQVSLVLPQEKTFVKALPASDSVDSFVRSLPYFKEELIIDPDGSSVQGSASGDQLVNHVAFEKKLIEDLERPFLESGKKVQSVVASVMVLATNFAQSGRYLLLAQFEKDTVVLAMEGNVLLDMTSFAKEVFAGRLNEFRLGKNFADIKNAFSVGVFEAGVLDKVRSDQGLQVSELGNSDIYDLVVGAMQNANTKPISLTSSSVDGQVPNSGSGRGVSLPSVDFSGISDRLPNQKWLFLVGAAIVGFALVILVAKNLTHFSLPKFGGSGEVAKKEPVTKTKQQVPPPPPAPTPADFKVRVLNGTTVAGEAGRAGDTIKVLGFDVMETKNATASGFAATRLRTTADVPTEIVDQLKTTLLSTYESVNVESLTDDLVKIEVIVGKKK